MKRRLIENCVCAALLSGSIVLIVHSVYVVGRYYHVPLYWDQWEYVKLLARDPGSTKTLWYFLSPHNEHIIATSKLLFLVDYTWFHLTNAPLVISILVLLLLAAWLLTELLFINQPRGKPYWAAGFVFSACALSLTQWENLLWGFQVQVPLVLVFALVSIFVALAVVRATRPAHTVALLVVLALVLPLGVFSMGNGVAIPLAVILLLIILRAHAVKWFVAGAMGTLCVAAFFVRTQPVPIGDLALRTPRNIAAFFFTMLGNPLFTEGRRSAFAGLFLFLTLAGLFIWRILLPWLRRQPVERAQAALFALSSFLLATAGAAAWARTSLGIGTAFASRYTTPMLFLWMALFALLARGLLTGSMPGWRSAGGIWLILCVVFVVAAGSSLRASNMANIRRVSQPIDESGYFVAAGILSSAQLAKLYPWPHEIISSIAFLRRERLNLFADAMGLPMPSAGSIAKTASAPSLPVCTSGSVEKIDRVEESGWSIRGWASDDERRSPLWALALDASGHLLGVVPPLVPRPDIAKAIRASGDINGFVVPVQRPLHEPVSLEIIPRGGASRCRLPLTNQLPMGPYPVDKSDLIAAAATVSREGVTASPGIPSVLQLAVPYSEATVFGTFAAGDNDTGTISITVAGERCTNIILPVVRGPNTTHETLTVRYSDDRFDTIDLKTIPMHTWTYLAIPTEHICPDGQPRSLTITLTDTGKDWGEWAAIAIPGFQR